MPLIYSAPPLTTDQDEWLYETEHHLHNWERWFGVAAVPNGEIHVADPIVTSAGAFQIDAGNDAFGAWVQIMGSADTPHTAGKLFYDFHEMEIITAERDELYVIQVSFGASGDAGITAGTYAEIPFKPASNLVDAGPREIKSKRQSVGTKTWARAICPGQNTATIDFYYGLHEYDR